jgi:catechol 2,3-dioxygenase-like lactoylglutathione lyase family enzyme
MSAFLSPVDSSYVRFRSIANHKMKTRCFDHIDLRVKDMEIARKFYRKFLPLLGFVQESAGDVFHTYYSGGREKPSQFFGFTEDKNHQPDGTRIAFWADTRAEVDRMAELVRERERGTLEQLLVSPLSRSGLMLGKLVPYLCIGMAMAVVLFAIMRFVFFVPIVGNVVAMMFSTLVYVFALLSLGLLVGTKAENQMQALQMSMVFLLPSVFFSGFIFPRETMPWIFYALGALFPTTYFIALMRAIILRGAHFLEYWPNLAVLIGMSILLFVLCALRFRKKIA